MVREMTINKSAKLSKINLSKLQCSGVKPLQKMICVLVGIEEGHESEVLNTDW